MLQEFLTKCTLEKYSLTNTSDAHHTKRTYIAYASNKGLYQPVPWQSDQGLHSPESMEYTNEQKRPLIKLCGAVQAVLGLN